MKCYINIVKRQELFFTPFDNESVDFLDELMPVFKIASADIKPTILRYSKKNKPLLYLPELQLYQKYGEQ